MVGTRYIGGVLAYPYSDSRGLHVFSIGADPSVPFLRSITVSTEVGRQESYLRTLEGRLPLWFCRGGLPPLYRASRRRV